MNTSTQKLSISAQVRNLVGNMNLVGIALPDLARQIQPTIEAENPTVKPNTVYISALRAIQRLLNEKTQQGVIHCKGNESHNVRWTIRQKGDLLVKAAGKYDVIPAEVGRDKARSLFATRTGVKFTEVKAKSIQVGVNG